MRKLRKIVLIEMLAHICVGTTQAAIGTSAEFKISIGQDGVVTVLDGDEAVKCTAEKVKEMFEATSDLGDWNGAAKLTPIVSVEDGEGTTIRFTVTPGDGTATQAFLRIRK